MVEEERDSVDDVNIVDPYADDIGDRELPVAVLSQRWIDLYELRSIYGEFVDFAYDCMEFLGFECSVMQLDIANYMQYGSKLRMVQAGRGEAKTTLGAMYAVWRLIQNPKTRVLIMSGGQKLSQQISTLIIKIIDSMPALECLRPSRDDRQSYVAYDVHHELKGIDKSPSIACTSIFGSIQGNRADLLLADDIEMEAKATTQEGREKLLGITLDLGSIVKDGDILYLGTPQTMDSIYNTLTDRGYSLRIYPARYPTEEEEKAYGAYLAPIIVKAMQDNPALRTGGGLVGDRGQPTDPLLNSEDLLRAREGDMGAARFNLQFMLNTSLVDMERYPLKTDKLIFSSIGDTHAPASYVWSASVASKIIPPAGAAIQNCDFYMAQSVSSDMVPYRGTVMYVDPSGGGANGDELGWAVTRAANGYIYLVDVSGMHGGLHEHNLKALISIAIKYRVTRFIVEKNYGAGALMQVITPMLVAAYKEAGLPPVSLEEVWETGQKELRIIDIIEPVIGTHRLVVNIDLIHTDAESIQIHPAEKRKLYSLWYQFSRITRGRGALAHDDRIDAVAGAIRPWVHELAVDRERERARDTTAEFKKLVAKYSKTSTLNRRRRR